MKEYIEREAVVNLREEFWKDRCDYMAVRVTDIMNIPAADVAPVAHGEWIEDGYSDKPCVCSNCGAEANHITTFVETFDYDWEESLQPTGYEEIIDYVKTPYCSYCGAKMN